MNYSAVWVGGALLLFASVVAAGPKFHTSCTLENHAYIVAHYDHDNKKLSEEELDDWRVTCTITANKKLIYAHELELARPTEFRDAMLATEEFRKVTAPRIIEDWRHNAAPAKPTEAPVPHTESRVPKP